MRVRLRCTTVGAARCSGTLRLRARLPGARRETTLAAASYAIVPGTRTVTVRRLGRTARRALRTRGSLRAGVVVTTRRQGLPDVTRRLRVTLVRRR